MQHLMKWEKRLDRVLETLVTLMFFSILMLTILLVIMRYGFNSSIIGGNEAMNYLFIYTTALGAAVSVGQGTHIKISFVVDHLPGRARRVVDMIGYRADRFHQCGHDLLQYALDTIGRLFRIARSAHSQLDSPGQRTPGLQSGDPLLPESPCPDLGRRNP